MSTFDPSLLPDPRTLSALRDQRRPATFPMPTGDWYTPMILYGQSGQPGTPDSTDDQGNVVPGIPFTPGPPIQLGVIGRIPIIFPCSPIGWYLSSDVEAGLQLSIDYAPPPPSIRDASQQNGTLISLYDEPSYTPIGASNTLPQLAFGTRYIYEELPWISGWPMLFERFGELRIWVTNNDVAAQLLLVLYMRKLKVR